MAIVAAAIFILAAIAGAECSLAAWRARSGKPDDVRHAVSLITSRADLLRQLAFLRPDGAEQYLQQAVSRNKYDARSLVEYGLLLEARGESAGAERALLNAYQSDNGYRTRWALAGFYYRKRDNTSFWLWASRAAERSGANTRSQLLDLCWRMKPSLTHVLRTVGDTCESRIQLLRVTERQDAEAAARVAGTLPACHDVAATNAFQEYVDRLLMSGDPEVIVAIWRAMRVAKGLPEGANLIANGDLLHRSAHFGFDWHFHPGRGIEVAVTPRSASLHLEFSGGQDDSAIVVWQPVVLPRRGDYELTFRATADGSSSEDLYWVLAQPREVAVAYGLQRTPLVSASRPAGFGSWRIYAEDDGLRTLALVYRRSPGKARFRGSVIVDDVRLQLLSPQSFRK